MRRMEKRKRVDCAGRGEQREEREEKNAHGVLLEGDLDIVGEDGEEDTDGVGGVEEVDEEEVVFGGGVVVASGLRGDEQGDGEFLALGELVFGVLEVP